MQTNTSQPVPGGNDIQIVQGHVHCPMCTHSVPAMVESTRKRMKIRMGQRCPRCHASLDAAAVLYLLNAA